MYEAACLVDSCYPQPSDYSITQALHCWCCSCMVSDIVPNLFLLLLFFFYENGGNFIPRKEQITHQTAFLISSISVTCILLWFQVSWTNSAHLFIIRYTVNLVVFFVDKKLPGLFFIFFFLILFSFCSRKQNWLW